MRQRIAVKAVDLRVLLPLMERVIECHLPESGESAASFRRVRREMESASTVMLGHAHGYPVNARALPTLKEISGLQTVGRAAVRTLAAQDRVFLDSYTAALPANHKTVVMTMLRS